MFNRFIKANGRHRTLEGWPFVFTALTALAILTGTVVEFAPLFLVDDSMTPPPEMAVWTPLEIAGRDLYIREGCNNCHSQMVRPFRQEIERYGDYSTAAETAYESPHLWGSKRTGPDLARVGGKYPHLWHVRHMEDPRSTSPGSIMPDYPWLLTRRMDHADLPARLRALRTVGLPYDDATIQNAAALAEAQAAEIAAEVVAQGGPDRLADKEITALVAYLQRLGTLTEPPPAEDDLEPHEIDETLETLTGTQPGEPPTTDEEILPLPPETPDRP
ncbi:MAG: cytochrome-c oxidase, cbb3-type subunit II [Rubricoccaceae bacterium]|nr:cytochrome-c oxidase, cbb3-type subunit II [Rubricoccaceae bacterium]